MSTTLHRTNVPAHALPKFGSDVREMVVSTVKVDGRYETAIIVRLNGRTCVLEPVRASKKADAGFEHDEAVAFCMGYRDRASKRADRWATLIEAAIAGRETYAGLESHEIGTYSRAMMWGEKDEAYPGDAEWSRIVD